MARGKAPMKKPLATKAAPITGGVKKPPRTAARKMHPRARMICRSKTKCIKAIQSQLMGSPYLKVFEDSCFGHLIHLPEIQLYCKVVYDVLLWRRQGVEDAMSFKIGDQEISFGEREFAMMSGLKFQGSEKIDHNPADQIRLMKVHFPGQYSVKLGDLIEKFNQLPNNNEDKLKLGLLYIAEAVIMGRQSHKVIDKGRFLLVDNLEEFNKYPWGKLSYKETVKTLIGTLKTKHVSKSEHIFGKVIYNLYGFPHVFQAWIFLSIPVLKQAYTEENEDCPHALNPRILHLKRAYKVPSHHENRIDLSDVNIKVVSSLHLTPEELKESYMSGLLSEAEVPRLKGHKKDSDIEELNDEDDSTEQWVANQYSNPTNSLDASAVKDKGLSNDGEVSGADGHENDSGIQALNGDDDAPEQWENNQYSSPTNSSKDDKQTRTTMKEYITILGSEDQDFEFLENLKLKLRSEIEILKVEREELRTDHFKLIEENAVLDKEKLKLGREIEILNKKKIKLGTDTYLLNKEKTTGESDLRLCYKEKDKLGGDAEILNIEKSAERSDICSLGKSMLRNDVNLFDREKCGHKSGINVLLQEMPKMRNRIEILNKEKTNLGNETELLNKEKTKLQSDKDRLQIEIESLSNEKTNMGKETDLLTKNKTKLGRDFEILYKESSNVKSEVELLHKMKRILGNDIESLSREKSEMETGFEFLKREKSTVQDDICSLNEKKTSIQDDICSLKEKKTSIQDDICSLNEKKTSKQDDICSLNEKKTVIQDNICLLNEKKSVIQDDIFSLNEKKTTVQVGFRSLNEKKTVLESEIESLSNEKTHLENETDLLGKEKMKLQTDIEFHNKEKAEFVRSVTADLSKSFYEREKTLAEIEKMCVELKEMNRTLVAKERCYTEELQEARQVLIKQMESEKSAKSRVIGVKRMRGDQVLWNFKEKKRATLKDVISFQLNRTDK